MNSVPTNTASEVEATRGGVTATGPEQVDVTFTPEAALETAHRLTEAAIEAKGLGSWRP